MKKFEVIIHDDEQIGGFQDSDEVATYHIEAGTPEEAIEKVKSKLGYSAEEIE